MKRVVITGATGMLGIALIKKLLKEKMEIIAIVRPNSSRVNKIPKSTHIHIIEADLSNLIEVSEKIKKKQDVFYHFAWEGTYGNSRNDMYMQTKNIQGTLNAMELAVRLGCEVFIGAGSQAEYGIVEGKMSPETATKPQTGYGIAKLCAGQMSKVVCEKNNMRYVWMRVLSVYGPHASMQTMVAAGISEMLKNKQPQYTKGEQMWDYLYTDDAAEAFWLVAENPNAKGIYCLGSGKVRKLSEYIKEIRDVVAPNMQIHFGAIPYYENQVMYLCADIDKLQCDTGFSPKIDFKNGIELTTRWIQEELKNEEN